MTETHQPLVSVVIATYNRADILPYAIRSVMLNEGIALEIIVVGDGCTDETAEAVARIGDNRIRYFNLPQNWGEQSVPSNEGISHARGEFVAFLNHDDLFLPWHLSDLLAVHRDGADVTWAPCVRTIPAAGNRNGTPGVAYEYEISGITPTREFNPRCFVVASATCYRKSVLLKLGGWTRASRTNLSPSQDLLFKAYKAGFSIRRTDRPSVLALFTGDRTDSYTRLSSAEHRWFFDLVQQGDERLYAELLRAGIHDAAKRDRNLSLWHFVLRYLYRHFTSLALRFFGVHPHTLLIWLRTRRHGGFVNYARQKAGLSSIDFRAREKERGKGL